MTNESKTELSGGGPVTPDHREINPASGQQKGYIVLAPEERAKGFVRPVRIAYVHKGLAAPEPLRDLTEDEKESYSQFGYVKYQPYPPGGTAVGRYWTQAQLDRVGKGCGTVTRMQRDIAETYAREPGFYGSTFCISCRTHYPVVEFVWDGTDELVGS